MRLSKRPVTFLCARFEQASPRLVADLLAAVQPLLSEQEFQASMAGIGPQMPLDEVFAAMRADAAD